MKKIEINFKERKCFILIENGISNKIGKLSLGFNRQKKAAMVTDKKIATLYLNRVKCSLEKAGFKVGCISLRQGEEQKNLSNLKNLYDLFLSLGLDRWSPVFALGGGVIGDLTGFAAATYKRGVPFFQIPTTLLAQVDASIGGKTAVNLPTGKNMVGAFYQPTAIFTDPTILQSLPERDIKAGLGEVIKFGMIKDGSLINFLFANHGKILAKDKKMLETIVYKTAAIKAAIVEKDEKEYGERVILNYGHTIGHVLESLTSYRHFRHGEAVAIGMECEALMALELGMISRDIFNTQHELIRYCGLQTEALFIKPSKIVEFLSSDKKARGGKVRFVLPERIGKVKFPVIVPEKVIYRAVNYICER